MALKPNLTISIFLGMILGIISGMVLPEVSQNFQLFSDIFLRLIKMIIVPLVFSTLVPGIAKLGNISSIGRIGIKTLVYFYGATIISLCLGLILVNYFEPGKMLSIQLPENGVDLGFNNHRIDFKSFIYKIFPVSIVDTMAKNEILPLIIFSIFLGLSLGEIKEKGEPIIKVLDSLADAMFKITSYVMYLSPFAVFGALSAVIGKQGLSILSGYFYLISVFYGGLVFFAVFVLGGVCYLFKINYLRLIKTMREPLILAFTTATSESAFPKTMEILEKLGCNKKIISFVLPMGYSFNLDASMIYMTFASIFIAQAYGIEISTSQQITLVLMLLLSSKGIAGVPRASLVVVAGVLSTFQIPAEGLLLLLGIDHILDMGRSAVNLLGNAVATCVINKWENPNYLIPKEE